MTGLVAGRDVEALLAAAPPTRRRGARPARRGGRRAAAAPQLAGRVYAGDDGIAELIAAAAGERRADRQPSSSCSTASSEPPACAPAWRPSRPARRWPWPTRRAWSRADPSCWPRRAPPARASSPSTASTAPSSSVSRAVAGERGGWASRAARQLADTPAAAAATAAGRPGDDPLLRAEEILLTGSGGPFRGRSRAELAASDRGRRRSSTRTGSWAPR